MSHISKPSSTFKERSRTSLNLDGYRASKSLKNHPRSGSNFASSTSRMSSINNNDNNTHESFLSKFSRNSYSKSTFNDLPSGSKSFDFSRISHNKVEQPSKIFSNPNKSFESSKFISNHRHTQESPLSYASAPNNEKLYPDVSITEHQPTTFSSSLRRSRPEPIISSTSKSRFSGMSSLPGSMPLEISKERLRSKLLNKTERTRTSLGSFIKKAASTTTTPIASYDKLFNKSFQNNNDISYSANNSYENLPTTVVDISHNINSYNNGNMNGSYDENIGSRINLNGTFSSNHQKKGGKYDGLFGNSQTLRQRMQEQENNSLHHSKFSSLDSVRYINNSQGNEIAAGEEFMPEPYYNQDGNNNSKTKTNDNNNNGIITSFVSKLSNLFSNSLNEYNEKLNKYSQNELLNNSTPQCGNIVNHLSKEDTEQLNQIIKEEKRSHKTKKSKKKSKRNKKKYSHMNNSDEDDGKYKDNKHNTIKKQDDTSERELKAPSTAASYATGTSTAVSNSEHSARDAHNNDDKSNGKHQLKRNIFTMNRYKSLDELKSERKIQLELLLKQKEVDMKDKEIERLNAKIHVLEDSIIDVKKSLLEMKLHTIAVDYPDIVSSSTPSVSLGSKRRFDGENVNIGDEDEEQERGYINDTTSAIIHKKKKYNCNNNEKTPTKGPVNTSIFKLSKHDENGNANRSAQEIVEDFKRISEKIKKREESAKSGDHSQNIHETQYSNYDDEFDESNIDETVAQLEKSVSELSPIRIPFHV